MEKRFIQLEELADKSETPAEIIKGWLSEGLFLPEGKAGDTTPVFTEESIRAIEKIKSLLELGYDSDEIRRIIKKVGLPSSSSQSKTQPTGKENYLTVGTLAEKIDVSPRTIKHWEEKGIIEPDLRSHGGFRLYRDYYILFCNLIKDLQLFGYSLDQIKTISDYFRDFVNIKNNIESVNAGDAEIRLQAMEEEIKGLFSKMEMLKNGMKRWEDLLRKQKKQITAVKEKNKKRLKKESGNDN